MTFVETFVAILGGTWMLALANKMVGDAWDVLFQERYKLWIAKFRHHAVESGKKILKGEEL